MLKPKRILPNLYEEDGLHDQTAAAYLAGRVDRKPTRTSLARPEVVKMFGKAPYANLPERFHWLK